MCCSSDLFLGIIAILFPPLAVWVKRGLCSADSVINILLCVLGYIPGLIHAWYIIAKFPDEQDTYERVPQHDQEQGRHGRVHYIIVEEPGRQPNHAQNQQPSNQNYGTAASSSHAAGNGEDNARAPPSYSEAVKGDHKIQTNE
ncbi:hypothetical protein F4808DRAFT_433222 [Astrocystis sublimbata]|nr:hypothetical protein F4808DRAFT_433222 [Astrocystis sublimbata]